MAHILRATSSPIDTGHGFLQRTALLYAAAFLIAMADAQVVLGLIFYSQDVFQASPRQIGWLTGMFSLTYSISCLIIQFFLHRAKPGYFIMFATILLGLSCAGMLYVKSLTAIFWLVGLGGISISFFWSPLMAWLSKGLEGAALNRRISWFNVSWSLGMIISPLACGFQSEISVRLPLMTSAILAFLTTGLITVVMVREPNDIRPGSPGQPPPPPSLQPQHGTLFRYPAWVGLFATFFCFGVVANIFPLVARKDFLFTESLIGLLLFVRALFNTLVFFMLGHTTFWHYRGWPMLAGQVMGALMIISLVFIQTPLTIGLVMAGIGISGALGYTTSVFHGIVGSARPAGRMAIHESLVALGIVSGSVVGGTACQAYTINQAYWICVGIVAIAMLIQGALCVRIRTRTVPATPGRPPGSHDLLTG